jgi:FKBP-type peptidyl-prolyl cis-trans isomerase 2
MNPRIVTERVLRPVQLQRNAMRNTPGRAGPVPLRPLDRIQLNNHRLERDSHVRHSSVSDGSETLKAQVGDVVKIHWSCLDDEGNVLESSKAAGEPTTFEIGAGDVVGNELFEAFDEAARGLSVGETIGIKADGGPWSEELLFKVPIDHPEIQRMEGRYKNQGGLHEGLIAELSNGGMAVVLRVDEELGEVTLDANSMMAGKVLIFEIEMLDISRS